MALHRLETSLSAPLAQASARRMFGDPAHRYDPAVRVRGGNQSVALELARRLGDRVTLRTPVLAVSHHSGGATVLTADGTEHEASAVIVAIPLPLLRELSLDPGLPDEVRAAASRTGFGDAAKLHVPLAEPPTPSGMSSPDATWWCWTSQATGGRSRRRSGPLVLRRRQRRRRRSSPPPRRWRSGPTSRRRANRLHWSPTGPTSAWTRGSYSVPGVGISDEDDMAWTRPWGSVVLAGEHTAGSRAATMNGAAASGARAAETALQLLGR